MTTRTGPGRTASRTGVAFIVVAVLCAPAPAGVYVTETSGIRWNDVGGIRWNDVGGIRWNDVGGIRWNDVGGIRWNDVGGILFTDASGIRWNDVGGIRWNDVGGLSFDDALATGRPSLDLDLLSLFSTLPDSSSINVVVTYRASPTAADLANLTTLGIPGGTIFRRLPMVVVNANRQQIAAIAALPAVRSVYTNRTLSWFDAGSAALIGLDEAVADPDLVGQGGGAPSGAGVTIAILDTGVDGTHPDLPYVSKLIQNVRLNGGVSTGPGFTSPVPIEGAANTDLVLGHGTFVASVAAGTGAASQGQYAGVAPGASILGLSAGDYFILNMLEGFDYILDTAGLHGTRVVNCSWGTPGWFDPDDPVNIATRLLHDAGITVVFASGNHGPSPDTLNSYSVAPWVIGVGSTRKDGSLSEFSSRGIYEEILYHPTLVAPGEGIIAAKPAALADVSGVTGVADPDGGVPVPPQHAAHYTASSGTSFAAPHVAGVVALMLEAQPTLTPESIKRILQQTATPILTRSRSEAGAGRLDAWASLSKVRDGSRPFGTHVPAWTDQRPYRIVHGQALESDHLLPAGTTLTLPMAPGAAAISSQSTLAWGTGAGVGDLDLRLLDGSGQEMARSDSFNGAGLFGRTEGIQLLVNIPASPSLEVGFKAGTGLLDQPFQLRLETATAEVTAYTDVASLPAADRDIVTQAVARLVMIGRNDAFQPAAGLTRGELARSLALAGGVPQRIPPQPSFSDTDPGDAQYPYVESIAGARAGRIFMEPSGQNAFKCSHAVRRLDFSKALVRAAGLAAEADARAGEPLPFIDEEKVPAADRGYAAVALERGFLDAVETPAGTRFDPDGTVSRLRAAASLVTLLGFQVR